MVHRLESGGNGSKPTRVDRNQQPPTHKPDGKPGSKSQAKQARPDPGHPNSKAPARPATQAPDKPASRAVVPQRPAGPPVFTANDKPPLDRRPPVEALHPNVTPENAAAAINGVLGDRHGDSTRREHVVGALRQHYGDSKWTSSFFRSLGSDRTAKLLNEFGDPARYGTRGAVNRDLGFVRHAFADMERNGQFSQSDMNYLTQSLARNEMNPYVATEIFGKAPNSNLKEKFVHGAVQQGGDDMNAGAVHVLGRLPSDRQQEVRGKWTSSGQLDTILASADKGARKLPSLADHVAQIKSGSVLPSAPDYPDKRKLFSADSQRAPLNPKPNKLPFDPHEGVSAERSDELDDRAHKSLWVDYGKDGELNYTDVGKIMQDIAHSPDLSEREKASLWSRVANQSNEHGVSLEGLRPEARDSFVPSASNKHVILGFDDGYHAPLAMLSTEQAHRAILQHENAEIAVVVGRMLDPRFPLNQGDVTASKRQVEALKEYLQGGFQAYANAWNRLYVQPWWGSA